MGYGNKGFSNQELFGHISLYGTSNNSLGVTEPIVSLHLQLKKHRYADQTLSSAFYFLFLIS